MSSELPAKAIVDSPAMGLHLEFDSVRGEFHLTGGILPLDTAPELNLNSQDYTPGHGLRFRSMKVSSGVDPSGPYQEVGVEWTAADPGDTPFDTSVRLYKQTPAVLFTQRFPRGATGLSTGKFGRVAARFPVFDPTAESADLHWLSYTYQDWPIPIRGKGWPTLLAPGVWPAAGADDGIREPLTLFRSDGECVVCSPVNHGLQQLCCLLPVASPLSIDRGVPASRYPGTEAAADEPGALAPARLSGAPGSDRIESPSVQSEDIGSESPGFRTSGPTEPGLIPSGSARTASPSVSAHRNAAAEITSRVVLGPEGLIDTVPPGAQFQSVLYFSRSSVASGILGWGKFLRQFNGKSARRAPEDLTARALGYWTDNGSAYYYHTEGNASYPAIMAALRAYQQENAIPVRYFQLDSWWYPKGRDGGTSLWQPDHHLLPGGVVQLQHVIGLPLALHNRYWSGDTPYRDAGGFAGGYDGVVPVSMTFFDQLFRTVSAWDCVLYEQDWLAPQFRRVQALQRQFGAADDWLSAMDTAAGRWRMPIQFCMPSIGFYIASSGLPNVTQIRSSRDFDRSRWESVRLRWMEHIQLSLLAKALGLKPSKDMLLTTTSRALHADDWELSEAILAILSDGPVGIGDPFGHTDSQLVGRLCREDGVLVQPDRPAIPIEGCITGQADQASIPQTLTTSTTVSGQTWRYVYDVDLGDTTSVAENPLVRYRSLPHRPTLTTAMLGLPAGSYVCYDLLGDRFLGVATPDRPVSLPVRETGPNYTILAPMIEPGIALLGDTGKFVTVSAARFHSIKFEDDGIQVALKGPEDSSIDLAVYAPAGAPTLLMAGRPVAATPSIALPAFGRPYADGAGSDNTGVRPTIWHFRFKLPQDARVTPATAVLLPATPGRAPDAVASAP